MLEAYTDGRLACAQGIMRNELGFIGPAPPVRGAPCATSSPKNPKISATADRDVFRRG